MSHQINLFNPALLPKRELFSARNVALGTLLSVLVIAISGAAASALLANRQHQYDASDADLKANQAQLTALAQQAASQKPNPELQGKLDYAQLLFDTRQNVLSALGALGSASTNGGGFVEYLRGLSRQSLNGLWLTKVVVGAGGSDLQINGRTMDRALLADYVERLNKEKSFAGRSFAGLQMNQGVETVAASGTAATPATESTTRPAPYIEFELTAAPAAAPKQENGDKKS